MDNQLIKIGFTWSCMSCVVQPGKEDTLTLLFFDILWNYRCFKIESPAMIVEGGRLFVRSRDLLEVLLLDCLLSMGSSNLLSFLIYLSEPFYRAH